MELAESLVEMEQQQVLAVFSLVAVSLLIIYMRTVIAPLKRVSEDINNEA